MNEFSNVCNIFTYSLVCLKSSLMRNIEKTIMKHIFVIFILKSSTGVIEFFYFVLLMPISDQWFYFFLLIKLWLSFEKAFNTHIEIFKLPLTAILKPDCPPWCSVSNFRFSTFCHWLIEDTSSPVTESDTSGRDRQAAEENLIK